MNQNPQCNSGNESCPICHGMGWELEKRTVFDYVEPKELVYAVPCKKCSGSRRIYDQTGVPDEFRDADIGKFKFDSYSNDMSKVQQLAISFFRDFAKWQNAGKGLYMWSTTPGSGKTFLSCCIAKSVMIKYDSQMRFITAPDYIAAVGDSYKRERGELDASAIYRECSLLVLDDIGAQADKDWQRQEMFRLINTRMEHGLITIYTSNMPVENLNVDDRTKDRIIKTAVVFSMPEESIRRMKAKSEQDEFLKNIL